MNIAFTGHRPDKLGGYDWHSKKNRAIINVLADTIVSVMNETNTKEFKFICGGALGIDQMAFDIVSIGREFDNTRKITLELAIPFKNQPCKWICKRDVERYFEQLELADVVTYVDKLDSYKIRGYQEDIYYPAKMQQRNKYMVDNCDILIAVWDGSKGGTANCVNYAKKLGKKIIYINPKDIKEEI